MRDDTVADVDREIVGRIARTPLRHEGKVPGAIVSRAGLRTGDKCKQATRGYRISEKVFIICSKVVVVVFAAPKSFYAHPIQQRGGGGRSSGERTGRWEPRRREGRRGQALVKLSASARQIGI